MLKCNHCVPATYYVTELGDTAKFGDGWRNDGGGRAQRDRSAEQLAAAVHHIGHDPMLTFELTDHVRGTIQQTLYRLLMNRRDVFRV